MDSSEYSVLHCTYNFEQPMDNTGKPSGKPRGGQIMITLESQGKYDLFHWMKEPEQTKDGVIIFFKRDALSRLQEVSFSEGYCVSLEEEFDAIDDIPMQKRIVISAKTITIGDMVFENSWGE
ncbi:type VI secretion system tube protein TssD [uncultured Maribacter sp.]|uniref:type VI secretion system tube protein TssD n=1 Tax=uncultured Maribacter sp. TaxID=431308 RepID=UPI0026341CE9|nr:type VI secretion system tube protein TssD [uncultured Maribacter sp.]